MNREAISPSQPLATPERPWLGLRAYTRETASYFYGREREIDELFRRVKLEPLTLLFGKSGLGKSSLLGAGLQPRLQVEGWRPVPIRLRFERGQPSLIDQVRRELVRALSNEASAEGGVELWTWAFDVERRKLIELERPVLIFDQFEECFTLAHEVRDKDGNPVRRDRGGEVAELISELAAVIERRLPDNVDPAPFELRESALRIVLTLRDDFLHELERWKKLLPTVMRNRVELRELRGPDALDVVLQPARKGPSPLVQTEVATRIVCFVAKRDPDTPLDDIDAVPPLLSLLCAELNDVRLTQKASEITAAHFGDEADKVLERFYDRCFEGMPGGVRVVIESLLIDNNGHFRESSSAETVLDEMRKAGVAEPDTWLAKLNKERLLTAEMRDGAQRIELTHDSLVALVARSRNAREKLEALETENREHAKQAAESRRLQREKRTKWLAAVFLMMTIALGVAIWFASEQRDEALAAQAESKALVSQAAERALGRARERLAAEDSSAYLAYLVESLSFDPKISAEEAALALQQQASPWLTPPPSAPTACTW